MGTEVDLSFEGAPKWARYRARDADGEVFWFEERPILNLYNEKWISRGESRWSKRNSLNDWQDSLVERMD
jgi:hypothetical protein